jgi:Fur family peroxide stress response transcriptional regulator
MEASTKQFRKRNAILHYLQSVTDHPSAETVFTKLKQEIPDLSMGTVYRNLNLFKNQGLAMIVATVKGVERFDGNTDPHVHFICTDCDAVIDLMDMDVPQELKAAAEAYSGGLVSDCQLSFTGLCSECKAKRENTQSA